MSFFSKAEAFFKKLFTNTSWEQSASTAIALVAPSLEGIVAASANEADAAEVQKVVSEVQVDLATISQLLNQAQGGTNVTATLTNVLESVKSNLGALLSAGHIKDAATLTKVTAIVNAVVGEVEAVLSALPK